MKTIPILLIGHGDLPKALIQSAQMLIGGRQDLYSLCLHEGDGLDNFINKTFDLMNKLHKSKEILVFVDLQGGTPWNAVVGINDPRIQLITGINLGMLIEVLCLRDNNACIDDLVQCALDTALMSVTFMNFKKKEK